MLEGDGAGVGLTTSRVLTNLIGIARGSVIPV